MSLEDYRRSKKAQLALSELFSHSEYVIAVHYSCESFYDRKEGTSPRITSIAARNLASGQTASFSIHQMAEREGLKMEEIENHYDALERKMLDEFFDYASKHEKFRWMHWNMRDMNFGFAALEHRHRVLGGTPYIVDENRKIDLARILVAKYGVAYTGHPRLETLIKKNNMTERSFLPGEKEAQAFENKDYVALHQSTLRKVDMFCNIAERAFDGSLKTNASWWQIHGGSIRGCTEWLRDHPLVVLLGVIASIASVVGFALSNQ